MKTDKDHIHLLIDYEPKVSILQEEYLKKHFWRERTFWPDGYFACFIGEGVSYDTIQEYIRNQG